MQQLPITLELSPSYRLSFLLAVAHGLGLAAVTLVFLPLGIKLALILLVLASACLNLLRLFGPHRFVSLTLRGDGILEFCRKDGSHGEASIHRHSAVTPLMTVLLLCTEGRSEALVLLPDAIAAEDFRLLRLWLRWRT